MFDIAESIATEEVSDEFRMQCEQWAAYMERGSYAYTDHFTGRYIADRIAFGKLVLEHETHRQGYDDQHFLPSSSDTPSLALFLLGRLADISQASELTRKVLIEEREHGREEVLVIDIGYRGKTAVRFNFTDGLCFPRHSLAFTLRPLNEI